MKTQSVTNIIRKTKMLISTVDKFTKDQIITFQYWLKKRRVYIVYERFILMG